MIQIENLTFRYRRRANLFANLNLVLDKGHIYGLLGRNGAGKTTLLKLMMGMLFPKAGNCRVLGYESRERRPAMLGEMLFVPEEFYAPEGSIASFAKLYAPLYPQFDNMQFDNYLREMEVEANVRLHNLSLGQKKKAMLAFALAANTKVLLLDEPTNGLDIPAKAQFRRMVAAAASDERCIVISTHQVRDIDKLIDSVVVLNSNRIALNQTVAALTERLAFRIGAPASADEFYSEDSIAGRLSIAPNTDGESTQLNLELLFNAVIAHPQKFQIF